MLDPGGAITLAAVAGVIRWSVAAFTTSPVLLAFVQPLHGFTFALLHLAAMQVIVRASAPFGCDSASHLRHIMHRAGHGLADPAFRPALWSDRGTAFLVMAALCLLALPMCARLQLSSGS